MAAEIRRRSGPQSVSIAGRSSLAIVLLAGFAGPARSALAPPRDASVATNFGAVPRLDLATRVRERLHTRLGASADAIQVEPRPDDEIVLTGTVDAYPKKQMADEAAGSVTGVQRVFDRLQVVAEPRTDAQLGQDVGRALRADPATSGLGVSAVAHHGTVTLYGEVATEPQKRLAEWVASDQRGVRGLDNEIRVTPQPRTDPEIHDALARHYATSPLFSGDHINVRVAQGVVTLSGEVASALEKDWARSDAWGAGVTGVDDAQLAVRRAPLLSRVQRETPLTDREVREDVLRAFAYDPRVMSTDVQVSVRQHVVTLAGAVPTLKAREEAVQVARNTGGVAKVIDRIAVKPPGARADSDVASDINVAFGTSASLAGSRLAASVHGGRASLTGVVRDAYQKWLAGDLAARTPGVVEVEDRIAIAGASGPPAQATYYFSNARANTPWFRGPAAGPPSAQSDAELLAAVKRHLAVEHLTSPGGIAVSVQDGVVILQGTVASYLQKGTAEDSAYEAGAREIDNRLEVTGG